MGVGEEPAGVSSPGVFARARRPAGGAPRRGHTASREAQGMRRAPGGARARQVIDPLEFQPRTRARDLRR